jgi:transcription antitermination factor NusG
VSLSPVNHLSQILPNNSAQWPWYAVRVRSNFEQVTAAVLAGKGYEQFAPTYKVRRAWSDRVKEIQVPLFPGYVFCRLDSANRLGVLTTPGVVNIVSFGKEPATVSDTEIEAIQTIVRSSLNAQPWPFVAVGRKVVLERGPLKGLEGIVADIKHDFRLVVSLTLLQRSVSVEVERDWIRPAPEAPVHRQ